MLQAKSTDLGPKQLFHNIAAPQGILPPASATQGGTEGSGAASTNLLNQTFQQVNTARVNGVGGKVDLLG